MVSGAVKRVGIRARNNTIDVQNKHTRITKKKRLGCCAVDPYLSGSCDVPSALNHSLHTNC
jgi:hypothetical protein